MPYDVPNYLVDVGRCADRGAARRLARDQLHPERFLQGKLHRRDGARRRRSIPYHYRRRLLRNSPKNLAVLDAAAQKADWGAPAPPGVFRGIAVNDACGSYCAQVVETSVDGGRIRVHRVISAIDCGHVVNPLSVEMQIQGAIVYALTAALYGEITIKDGARRAIEFRRLTRCCAWPMRRSGRDRDRAQRRFLGRRRRAAGAAAGAGFVQRDLRRHRQAHPLAAVKNHDLRSI